MATASRIALDVDTRPIFGVPHLSKASADRTSELLQQNHEKHHIFFNDLGFHNHIVHHHLSLYALGAAVPELDMQYKHNVGYQRADKAEDGNFVSCVNDAASFKQNLGRAKHYRDFIVFFRNEVAAKGWKEVLNEYLFKGDAAADDMLVRLFDGLIHPIIHLGFAVEFEQPALVAEALAVSAVHSDYLAPMMLEPEKLAAKRGSAGPPPPTFLSLVRRAAENEAMANSSRDGGFGIEHGLFEKALQPFVELAAEYTVSAATLEQQLDEMIRTSAIICFASQHPEKVVKTDFFLIHTINCSLFLSRFFDADWISEKNKVRLLEWKVRMDLAIYLAVGAPKLDWSQVTGYQPRHPHDGWEQLFERANKTPEDGHIIKLLRALAHGCELKGNTQVEDLVVGPKEWLLMAHMALDSTESGGPAFVRKTGARGAWDGIPARDNLADGKL